MLCSLAKKDKFVPSTNDGILHLDKGIANEPPCHHQESEQPILFFFAGFVGIGWTWVIGGRYIVSLLDSYAGLINYMRGRVSRVGGVRLLP